MTATRPVGPLRSSTSLNLVGSLATKCRRYLVGRRARDLRKPTSNPELRDELDTNAACGRASRRVLHDFVGLDRTCAHARAVVGTGGNGRVVAWPCGGRPVRWDGARPAPRRARVASSHRHAATATPRRATARCVIHSRRARRRDPASSALRRSIRSRPGASAREARRPRPSSTPCAHGRAACLPDRRRCLR